MDFTALIQQLPAAEKTKVTQRLNEIQMEVTFQAINKSVENCFNQCINSFRSKNIDNDEKECLTKCAGKFIACSERVGGRFTAALEGQ